MIYRRKILNWVRCYVGTTRDKWRDTTLYWYLSLLPAGIANSRVGPRDQMKKANILSMSPNSLVTPVISLNVTCITKIIKFPWLIYKPFDIHYCCINMLIALWISLTQKSLTSVMIIILTHFFNRTRH